MFPRVPNLHHREHNRTRCGGPPRIERAIEDAKARNPATRQMGLRADWLAPAYFQEPESLTRHNSEQERRMFVMRLQQLTGPVMAKGVEDTVVVMVLPIPLASLNEVSEDPDEFGVSPRLFHHKSVIRLRHWPRALLATSTHDTKRSEDVRARINVLSEIPVKWYEAVRHWSQLNRHRKTWVDRVEIPDLNAEYLLYQTLVGLWPLNRLDGAAHADLVRRVQAYMEKALKEAKVYTSWINPNHEHDQAVRHFVAAILESGNGNTFFDEFSDFVAPIAKAGLFNSLSQLILKIASPGIPDFYQGSETWDFSLVDPDNRRPVDFARRSWARENSGGRLKTEV